MMILHFANNSECEIKVLKETKKYLTFLALGNYMKYRLNKETGEVQDNTYKRTIKGLYVSEA